jgi:hypothetical protein
MVMRLFKFENLERDYETLDYILIAACDLQAATLIADNYEKTENNKVVYDKVELRYAETIEIVEGIVDKVFTGA